MHTLNFSPTDPCGQTVVLSASIFRHAVVSLLSLDFYPLASLHENNLECSHINESGSWMWDDCFLFYCCPARKPRQPTLRDCWSYSADNSFDKSRDCRQNTTTMSYKRWRYDVIYGRLSDCSLTFYLFSVLWLLSVFVGAVWLKRKGGVNKEEWEIGKTASWRRIVSLVKQVPQTIKRPSRSPCIFI